MKLSCVELKAEHSTVSEQIKQMSNAIDNASLGSRLAMGVGVIFWPALFLVDSKGDAQDELARLKGQKISIKDAMLAHSCSKQLVDIRIRQSEPQARIEQSVQTLALAV